MAFRQRLSLREAWQAFCNFHTSILERLPRLAVVFRRSDRFDDYLQRGNDPVDASVVSLSELESDEWRTLVEFVKHYKHDWQSWFVRTWYVARFAECERRNPST